jgi:hypothetical protein
MKTIFKQIVTPNSVKDDVHHCSFQAAKGARPVSVGRQGKDVCVWFECDPKLALATCIVYCVGTGFGAVPEDCRFLGTVIADGYVWHFYTPVP